MPRYRVTVTRPEAHFVDAESMAEAAELGIMAVVERARPAYYLAPQADVARCADEAELAEHATQTAAVAEWLSNADDAQNGQQSHTIEPESIDMQSSVVSVGNAPRRVTRRSRGKNGVPHVV